MSDENPLEAWMDPRVGAEAIPAPGASQQPPAPLTPAPPQRIEVVITGVEIGWLDLMNLQVKIALSAIPAGIILACYLALFGALAFIALGVLGVGIGALGNLF